MARRLIREEGLLCGGSCGAVMCGALEAAQVLKEGKNMIHDYMAHDTLHTMHDKHILTINLMID